MLIQVLWRKRYSLLYFIVALLLFISIMLTPKVISGKIFIFEEEVVQMSLVFMLLLVFVFSTYKLVEELNKIKQELISTYKYIGKLNVKQEGFVDLVKEFHLIPNSRNDYKKLLKNICYRTLGLVHGDWVRIRLVNGSLNTLIEVKSDHDGSDTFNGKHISNKSLMEGLGGEMYYYITSSFGKYGARIFCMANVNLNEEDNSEFFNIYFAFVDVKLSSRLSMFNFLSICIKNRLYL
ncbi:hypothetical protein COT97_02875 [Candidatus Falkowbacteria bacterium CG10_big_fil_rev_8_21_14_0_10_39_11]|uniref:Uncharacterized protein n=1 Tax=Candidatus Falkowbacteria bacterium CG10_big_fil_rev_8_21_14_0_10_39_11 TaxID=1974565 RepID=A0A2H0V4W5_9BACT|nr:MAG: hypothetical protein COT97_02875 [Candidatus Falkowbacteria bacterium CG10_big_fil_rev_8_21_14_0_10_39_11]